ncbi:hypothetical protein L6452_17687 [Arctium lappa]|uniref:Uncharacterized protein n=1 Tax=Arctium lappa TaxID=4217 RepID=A0ACB9C460_ARCLA|nr:hypothetical protein L6452_17687 [Arctium lappa]
MASQPLPTSPATTTIPTLTSTMTTTALTLTTNGISTTPNLTSGHHHSHPHFHHDHHLHHDSSPTQVLRRRFSMSLWGRWESSRITSATMFTCRKKLIWRVVN